MLGYAKVLLSQSWADTWALLLGAPLVPGVLAILVFLVFLHLIRKRRGPTGVKEEAETAALTLLATAIVFVPLLVFHVLLLSPARLYFEQKGRADALELEARGVRVDLATLKTRQESLEGDNQHLRDNLADSRDARVIKIEPTVAPPPRFEGGEVATRMIASADPDYGYAMEVIIQFKSDVQKITLGFVADRPIKQHCAPSGTVLSQTREGRMMLEATPAGHTCLFGYNGGMSIIGPARPWVTTIYSKVPFHLLRAERISD